MLKAIFENLSINHLAVWFSEYQVVGIFLIGAYLFHFIPTTWDYKLVKPLSKLGVVGNALLISLALIFFSEFKRVEPFISQIIKPETIVETPDEPQYKVQQFEYYKF